VTITMPDAGTRFMTMRDALIVLNSTLPDLRRAFGSKAEVDEVRHLIGTAAAWGSTPDKDAIYLNITHGYDRAPSERRISPGSCRRTGWRRSPSDKPRSGASDDRRAVGWRCGSCPTAL
jgi:hypothetical protein